VVAADERLAYARVFWRAQQIVEDTMTEEQEQLRDRIRDSWPDYPVLVRIMAEVYLKTYPQDGLIWAFYGDTLRCLGCFADAKTALQKARDLAKKDNTRAGVDGFLAHVHCELGEYGTAEALYRRAAALQPTDGKWQLFLGITLRRQGRDREAEECYRKALDMEGDRDEYLLNLGFVLQARGALEEAARCFSEALQIDPAYEAAKASLEDVRNAQEFIARHAPNDIPRTQP
jgi:Flp pilus assembly protein TadD